MTSTDQLYFYRFSMKILFLDPMCVVPFFNFDLIWI
jgi:hypothetical protein